MATVGYLRVSTDKQSVNNQRLAIHEYCNRHKDMGVDDWLEVSASTRRTSTERKLDELLNRVQEGDTVLVAELSRLGRSVGQIAILVDAMIHKGVRLICIKERIELNGKPDIQTKTMLTMFSLFAEIERDLISERTKEGLMKARAEGKLLGRPKGKKGYSKLDGKEQEIKDFIRKGVSVASIAKIFNVGWSTMKHFIKSRRLG